MLFSTHTHTHTPSSHRFLFKMTAQNKRNTIKRKKKTLFFLWFFLFLFYFIFPSATAINILNYMVIYNCFEEFKLVTYNKPTNRRTYIHNMPRQWDFRHHLPEHWHFLLTYPTIIRSIALGFRAKRINWTLFE